MELQGGNCSVCSKVFGSDPVTAAEEVLDLFEFLVETINRSALQNTVICAACIEKLNEAVNFKMSLLVKQENGIVETKQEIDCDEKFIMCYICKNFTKTVSAKPLFNSCYENVIGYMIPEKDLDHADNLRICDDCHKSLLNFQNINLFLSVYDLNQLNNDTVIGEDEFKIDIVNNCLAEDNVELAKELKQEIKEEIEKSEKDIQKKQELDLKLECKAEPSNSSIFWTFNSEEQERTSTLPCPESDPDLKSSISKIKIDYKLCSNNLKSEKNKSDGIKMFKCTDCEFQTKYKNSLKTHMFTHKNIDEVEMFKCENCQFQTKYKGAHKLHILTHKGINEVKKFICQDCNFQTKRKGVLTRHILLHKKSNEIEMFKCTECEFQTKHKYYLKQHILIHKGINEIEIFKCQNCNFQTKRKGALKSHILIHKNIHEIKMFKCQKSNCDFQTKYKYCLKTHELIHKSINEVEMFNCQNCKFQTKYKNHLRLHVRVHKDINDIEVFKCTTCDFQTILKSNLKRHIRNVHRNIK